MATCQFVFDIVLTHLECTGIQNVDPSKLEVNTVFGNAKVLLKASSINVNEFKPGGSIDMQVTPKSIRKALEKCGMPMTVAYNSKMIGVGNIILPENVIDKIDEGMTDLMHAQGCSFVKDDVVVGNLEMLFRLIIKCEEQPQPGENTCRLNMDKSINREDIMFIMSESQRCPSPCDPCLDMLEPDEGDERLKLDFQRYRSSNAGGSRVADTFIHNPEGDAACCQLKKMAQECNDIVDSITKRIGQPKPLKSPCRRPEEQGGPCNDPGENFLADNQLGGSNGPCFSYLPARQGDSPDFCDPALIPVSISDLHKPSIKPVRFCPVCLTNMSWLPKFAACPKCGVKPMPVVEERHKKERLTSEQIILEFLGKSKDLASDCCLDPCDTAQKNEDDECRCTCKFGKLCAHCRIRQLCADIFQASKNEPKCPTAKPKSSEDFCVLEEDPKGSCRPYLAHVFSELRDLYEIKDSIRSSQLKIECAKMVTPEQSRKGLKTQRVAKQSQRDKTKKEPQPKERKITAGHKACLDQRGAVSRRHGWAWGQTTEASKNGWRPGSVRKSVKRLMQFFLEYSPEDNAFKKCKEAQEADEEKNLEQPTLHVCKKNGEIAVTLRALNNPNMQMKPIVFNLVKSDLAVALRQIKKKLKDKGFRKCTCHQPVMLCVCRNIMEKKQLEDALQKECNSRGMANCVEHLMLTDTSDSELEYEFDVSPPAALPMRPSPPKSKTVNKCSQTDKKDLIVPSKYPTKLDPYWRAYDCATGGRYSGTGDRIRGGGRGGPGEGMGGANGKPGAGGGKSGPIPVRMPKRYTDAIKQAAKDKEQAIQDEIQKKKKGIDLMKYLMQKGSVPTPWDPNNPKPKEPTSTGPVVGPDGLTDAQRKRRALQQMCVPPLDSMPRLGKGYDPCQCYNYCGTQCCYPCCYCC